MKKRKRPKLKMFILRKYVMAKSLKHALRIEKERDVFDGYLDTEWKEKHLTDAIGFDDGVDLVGDEDVEEEEIPEV